MLRFRQFVEGQEVDYLDGKSADYIASRIYNDCQPFLTESGFNIERGEPRSALWRGQGGAASGPAFLKFDSRVGRSSSDTFAPIHKLLDDWFKQQFGFPYRSAGVFTTGRKQTAHAYGPLFLFFPIGPFKFVWSDDVHDAFSFFDGSKFGEDPQVIMTEKYMKWFMVDEIHAHDDSNELFQEYITELRTALKRGEKFGYADSNLKAAIQSHDEVMIQCSSYYLLYDQFPHSATRERLMASHQVLESLGKFLNPR
jgi:hypothetical protein